MEARTKNGIIYKVKDSERHFFKKVMTHNGKRIIIDTRLEPNWMTDYLHISGIPFEVDNETRKKAEFKKQEVSKIEEEKQEKEMERKAEKRKKLIEENDKNLKKSRIKKSFRK